MTLVMTPSESSISPGQTAKLFDLFVARIRKSGLVGDKVQRVIEVDGDAITNEMVAVVYQRVEVLMILVPCDPISITTSQGRNPDNYYRSRSGLWVYHGMRGLVVKKAKAVASGSTFSLAVNDLGKGANDAQIEGGRKDHLFSEDDLCAIIAEMIEAQSGGKDGPLLNNGYANLFYTGSCVVRVFWYAGRRKWYVSTWERGGRWFAGARVFSPAN